MSSVLNSQIQQMKKKKKKKVDFKKIAKKTKVRLYNTGVIVKDTTQTIFDMVKTLFIICIFLGIFYFLFIRKIPTICYGCEEPSGPLGLIFRCSNDTSPDSQSCRVAAEYDIALEDISNKIDDARTLVSIVFSTTSKIPGKIKELLTSLFEKVKSTSKKILENILNFASNAKNFLSELFTAAGESLSVGWQSLKDEWLKPFVEYVIMPIITPFIKLFSFVGEFIGALKQSFKSLFTSDSESSILSDTIDLVVNTITSIPSSFIGFLNWLLGGISWITEGIKNFISTSYEDLFKTINTVLIKNADKAFEKLCNIFKPIIDIITENVANNILKVLSSILEWDPPIWGLDKVKTYIPNGHLIATAAEIGIPPLNCSGDFIPDNPLEGISEAITSLDLTIPYLPSGIIDDTADFLKEGFNIVTDFVGDGISNRLKPVTNKISQIYSYISGGMTSALSGIIAAFKSLFAPCDPSKEDCSDPIIDGIKDIFRAGTSKTKIFVSDIARFIREIFIDPFAGMIKTSFNFTKDAIGSITKQGLEFVIELKDSVSKAFNGLIDTAAEVTKYIAKNGLYIGFFSFARTVDLIIPINTNRTNKLIIVILFIFILIFSIFGIPIIMVVTNKIFLYIVLLFTLLVASVILSTIDTSKPSTSGSIIDNYYRKKIENRIMDI